MSFLYSIQTSHDLAAKFFWRAEELGYRLGTDIFMNVLTKELRYAVGCYGKFSHSCSYIDIDYPELYPKFDNPRELYYLHDQLAVVQHHCQSKEWRLETELWFDNTIKVRTTEQASRALLDRTTYLLTNPRIGTVSQSDFNVVIYTLHTYYYYFEDEKIVPTNQDLVGQISLYLLKS